MASLNVRPVVVALTPIGLDDLLKLAGQALRHLPPEYKAQRVNWWPEVLSSFAEAYGWAPIELPRLPATIEEVSALDRVLDLSWCLTGDQRQVVMGRALSMSWRKIMRARRKFRHWPNSHETCRKVYRDAISKMLLASVHAT